MLDRAKLKHMPLCDTVHKEPTVAYTELEISVEHSVSWPMRRHILAAACSTESMAQA